MEKKETQEADTRQEETQETLDFRIQEHVIPICLIVQSDLISLMIT